MKTQLQQWGNSLAIRIPREVLHQARLRRGDDLELEVSRPGSLKIRRMRKKKLSLAQLVRGMNRKGTGETDWGRGRGREEW